MIATRRADALRRRVAGGGELTTIRVLVAFESVLYSAITPLLPHYAHALGASKAAIGVLAAAYSAGLIPGSLLGGWLAARAGARRTTIAGLTTFAAASAAYGFGSQIVMLDAFRVVQGIGSGLIWGGGFTWAIALTPRERRGAVIGSVIGAAVIGTLIGPLIGTLAVAVGQRPVFAALGGCSLALAALIARRPTVARSPADSQPGSGISLGRVWRGVRRDRRLILGIWLIGLDAGTMGVIYALIPLQLASAGGSADAIGATFLVASALSAVVSPVAGRLCDRQGNGPAVIGGLLLAAPLAAILPLLGSPGLLAFACVLLIGGALSGYIVPAAVLIAEASERLRIDLAAGTMLLNLAWAIGQTIGAPAAGALAQASGNAVPLLLVAAVTLVTLLPVLARRGQAARRRARGEQAEARTA